MSRWEMIGALVIILLALLALGDSIKKMNESQERIINLLAQILHNLDHRR